VSLRDARQGPKRLVYRLRIWKHEGNVGVQDDDVRAFGEAPRVLTSNAEKSYSARIISARASALFEGPNLPSRRAAGTDEPDHITSIHVTTRAW
jgi:hypothetical protein